MAALVWCLSSMGVMAQPAAPYQVSTHHVADGVDVDVFAPHAPASGPNPAPPRPAVLLIPGGGWSTSDRSAMHPLCDALARQGFVAVTTSYRHAPEHVWPAQLRDVVQVVWLMREQASALGIDAQRIAVIGASAGALLAGHLGSQNWHAPQSGVSSQVQKVISIGGPWNLAHVLSTFAQYHWQSNPVYPDMADLGMLRNLFGRIPSLEQATQASPYHAVGPGSAPTLMLHGTADTLVPAIQSTETCAHIRAQGAWCETRLFAGVGHTITPDFWSPIQAFLSDWLPKPQAD